VFKSIEFYSGVDPCPGVELGDIPSLGVRAYALMIRRRGHPLLSEHFLNVVGAIEMLSGLHYHQSNIIRLGALLASAPWEDSVREEYETNVFHEAVAYVNRMGQFYYFARSACVRKALNGASAHIPTIEKFIGFRMKYTAHRSIDVPRGEAGHVLEAQARTMSRAIGMIMTLKPGAPERMWSGTVKADSPEAREMHRQQWQTRDATFQLLDDVRGIFVNLTIAREHESIAKEAYGVIASILA
jgi:hypothetical protein